MTFDFAAAVAVDYWAEQDIAVPCQPTHYVMSPEESAHTDDVYEGQVDMLTDPAVCEIAISPLVDYYRTDRIDDWIYCQDVTHEFGHLAGFDDSDQGGIMDLVSDTVPFGCAHQRQWMVLQGWRKPPRWVRRSPNRVGRLWLAGHGYSARSARQQWLRRR